VLAGGALQAATGFGFSLIASPVLVAAYGSGEGISTLTVLSVAVNLLTLLTERRRPAGDWPLAARLVALYVPGAIAGAVLLRLAGQDLLDVLVAVAVLSAITVRLLPSSWELRLSAPAAGLLAGAFGTSTGVSGPPLILHLLHTGTPPLRMRDTLAGIFLATALLSLVLLPIAGVFSLPAILPGLLLAVVIGHALGRGVFARMGPAAYERVVLATMAASAVATLGLLLR
jgi:uncharacterized protein